MPSTKCSTGSWRLIRSILSAWKAVPGRLWPAMARAQARSDWSSAAVRATSRPSSASSAGPRRRRRHRQRLRLAAARSDPRVHARRQRRRRGTLHVRQLCRRRDELRHGRRDGGHGGHRGPHGADHRRRRLGTARPAREAARGGGQLLHLQGGGCGLRPDAAARRGRADRAKGERPHLHHGRGARALLVAADPPAELRARRGRDGDRHGHPRRAGVARGPLQRADDIVDQMLDRSWPRWRRRPATGWRCWSTGWGPRR